MSLQSTVGWFDILFFLSKDVNCAVWAFYGVKYDLLRLTDVSIFHSLSDGRICRQVEEDEVKSYHVDKEAKQNDGVTSKLICPLAKEAECCTAWSKKLYFQ